MSVTLSSELTVLITIVKSGAFVLVNCSWGTESCVTYYKAILYFWQGWWTKTGCTAQSSTYATDTVAPHPGFWLARITVCSAGECWKGHLDFVILKTGHCKYGGANQFTESCREFITYNLFLEMPLATNVTVSKVTVFSEFSVLKWSQSVRPGKAYHRCPLQFPSTTTSNILSSGVLTVKLANSPNW